MVVNKIQYKATEDLVGLYKSNRELFHEDCADFVNDLRDNAIAQFELQGVPHKGLENYKYSDLRPSFEKDYASVPRYIKQEVDLHDIFQCDVPKLEAQIVLMINGWYYLQNRKVANLPDGVICGSLQYISKEHPEIIRQYYGQLAKVEKDPLVALNTALAKDGLVFYVPNNVVVEKPIQIINLLKSSEGTFSAQRNLFVLGKNSEATVLLCDHSLNDNSYLSNSVSECFVGEEARFNFYSIQNQHNEASNFNSVFFQQEAKSNINTSNVILNGGVIRNNISVVINGEYAEANLSGLSLLDGKQHADNFITVDHKFANCQSTQMYKNVLDEEATGAFSGRIHVHRDAQKTLAFQRNNNVLMCERSQMNTKPQLIIDADDVRCSHGATVGQIDEDALFYLRARGIDQREARLMLMFAFANEVLDNIKLPVLRERIEELVDRRLRGDLNPCESCEVHCDVK